MKKITTLFAAAVMAASASAQTVTESKTFDNMYFGINTGVSTATKGHHWLQDFRPNLGVRLGRNFTPVAAWCRQPPLRSAQRTGRR